MKPSVTPESSGGPNIEKELWKQDLLAPSNKIIQKYSRHSLSGTSYIETESDTHQDCYLTLFNAVAITYISLLELYFWGAFNAKSENGSDQSDL